MGLLVPWQGPRGQAAQPVPTPGLAPSPAHTLSRGLGNTGSEIPTIPSSLSGPAHLLSERHLHSMALRRGRASMAQKWKLRSSPSPHHLHPLERRGREGLREFHVGQDSSRPYSSPCRMQQDPWAPIHLQRVSANTSVKPPE